MANNIVIAPIKMQRFNSQVCIGWGAMTAKNQASGKSGEPEAMAADEFIKKAQDSGLTERQAIAFFNRRVANVSRQETAEALGTSPSNIDNLERSARQKIDNAYDLVKLAKAVNVDPVEL
jgi:DNA-binding CsgD family transcriptional regulator